MYGKAHVNPTLERYDLDGIRQVQLELIIHLEAGRLGRRRCRDERSQVDY
jgi:hypothetical protein